MLLPGLTTSSPFDMIKHRILRKYPLLFLRILGISVKEFDAVIERLKPIWEKNIASRYKRPGRDCKLDLAEMAMVLFVYYRHYVTQEFVGMLFNIDKATVCRIIKKLEPLLLEVVPLPERNGLQPHELESLIIDATENHIERPKRNQEKYYSGKKKRHAVKTEIRTTKDGRIINVSKTVPGTMHDFELFKQGEPLPDGTRTYTDAGYQGIQDIHVESEYPYKKPKNGELTDDEKGYNTALSKFRVKVENVLGDIKVFRIMSHRYRNKLVRFNEKIRIIAGLVNLRNGFGFA
jgi:hypothetical protein